jgi:2-polyprenyl-3-methyl-5-hydroxy-6-metoxy-1,4-benzoquinol methylase
MDINSQKQFYNEYWQNRTYDINNLRLQRCAAILEAISWLPVKEPKIMDLGCGTGWLTSILGHIGPTVGVDLSNTAVQEASQKYPYIQFIQADLLAWEDSPEKSFDIVVSQEVIEHFENPKKYIDLAYRLLKKDGTLILTTPNARTFNAMPEEQSKAWAVQPIENWLTAHKLKNLLQASGFEITHITTVIPSYGIKGIYRLFASQRLKAALKKIRLEKMFLRLRLKLGLGLHLFVAAKKISKISPKYHE